MAPKRAIKPAKGRPGKQAKPAAEDPMNEEIESSDDEVAPRRGRRVACKEESEDEVEQSGLSAEEKRLLMAQEYMEKLGLSYGAAELEGVVKSLEEQGSTNQKDHLEDVASSLLIAAPIVRPCAKHMANCVEIDPSDSYAYTGGKDAKIYQWNVETGQRTVFPGKIKDETCGGHFGPVNAMRLGINGRLLISVGADRVVRIWDTRQVGKACIASMRGHQKEINCVASAADMIYTGSSDKSIRVYSVLTQKCMGTEYGHTEKVTCMESIEKDLVLTGGEDETVRLWKIDQNKHSMLHDPKSGSVDAVAMITNKHFLSAGQDGRISMWSASRKKPMHVSQPTSGPRADSSNWVSSIVSLPGTNLAFSGSDTGIIQQWKAEVSLGGELTAAKTVPVEGVINDMRISKSGAFLVAASSKEGRLGRWTTFRSGSVGLVIVPLRHSMLHRLN